MRIKVNTLKRFLERAFVIFALFLGTAPLTLAMSVIRGGRPALGEGDPGVRVLWYGVYGVTLFLILPRLNRFAYVALQDIPLLVVTGLALVSMIWSTSTSLTLRRSVALVGTTLLGIYIAERFDMEEQLRLLAWALGIVAVLSLLSIFLPPYYGITSQGKHYEAWRGIYNQKGALGRYMSLGALTFFILTRTLKRRQWVAWIGFGLSVTLFLFSTSVTASLAFLGIAACIPLYKILRRKWHHLLTIPFVVLLIFLVMGAGTFIYLKWDSLLELVGKSSTVSGRLELWPTLGNLLAERPLLGYGYSGFWVSGKSQVHTVWFYNPWRPKEAHNSFLEVALQLGIVGLLFVAWSFFATFWRTIRWFRRYKTTLHVWPLVYLTFVFLISLTGDALLKRNELFWILYIATDLTLLTSLQKERERRRALSKVSEGHSKVLIAS